jgi:hypothetical protein
MIAVQLTIGRAAFGKPRRTLAWRTRSASIRIEFAVGEMQLGTGEFAGTIAAQNRARQDDSVFSVELTFGFRVQDRTSLLERLLVPTEL